MIDRYMALGFPANLALSANQYLKLPFPRLTTDQASQDRLVTAHGLDRSRLVAICPDEFGPAKQWPIDHFSDLVTRLIDDGLDCLVGLT